VAIRRAGVAGDWLRLLDRTGTAHPDGAASRLSRRLALEPSIAEMTRNHS